MEWVDAYEAVYSGQMVPTLASDTTGAALPSGSIWWKNLGSDGGFSFDLLVTVSSLASEYSELLTVDYQNPMSRTTS